MSVPQGSGFVGAAASINALMRLLHPLEEMPSCQREDGFRFSRRATIAF